MEVDSRHIFEEEIVRLSEKLKTLDPLSDDYRTVSERLLKLHEADMNELKADREFQKRCDDITLKEMEHELKKEEAKAAKKNNWLRLGIELGGIVIPAIAYDRWFHDGLKWEVDHTFTSTWMRNLLGKLKPTKR